MKNQEENKYYIDVSKYNNLDEIMYDFIIKIISNSSKSDKDLARSYWGLGVLDVVVPKTEAMFMSQAAELEQLAITDITALSFKERAKEFLLNKFKNNNFSENIKTVSEKDVNKILAYLLNSNMNVKITDKNFIKKITTLFEASQTVDPTFIKSISKQDIKQIVELTEEFRQYFKDYFLKNEEKRLIMAKSNPEVKSAVVKLYEAIESENLKRGQDKKLNNLDINIENFKSNYNFDSIIFCGMASIITDEIKSGLPSFMSKYSANWKGLEHLVDVVSTIIANTSIANDILFNTTKEQWLNSIEYKELQEKLNSGELKSEKDREEYAYKQEEEFVIRKMSSTIEFNTFPEIYIHTIINRRSELEKAYAKKYEDKLSKLSPEHQDILKNYNSNDIIKDFCNIMYHKDTEKYSIQIDERIAIPYIQNEIKEINFSLIVSNINNVLENFNIDENTKNEINNSLKINFEENNKISIEDLEKSKEDLKTQFLLLFSNAEKPKNISENRIKTIKESVGGKIEEIFNNLVKALEDCENIDNKAALYIHNELKKCIKDEFSGHTQKVLYAEQVNKLIKNIYENMDLTLLKIDKNKQMFKKIETILVKNGIPPEKAKEIMEFDGISTSNIMKVQTIIMNELQGELQKNLSNVAKSITKFIHGNFFKNVCGFEDFSLKHLYSKSQKVYFTEQLSRGTYDVLWDNNKNNSEKEKAYESLENTLNIGKEFIKLCKEKTKELDRVFNGDKKTNTFNLLEEFRHKAKPEIANKVEKEKFEKEYQLKESIIKELNKNLDILLSQKRVSKDKIKDLFFETKLLYQTQITLLKDDPTPNKVNKCKEIIKESEKNIKEIISSIEPNRKNKKGIEINE